MDTDLIGNKNLRSFLFSLKLKKRLGHAYLFVGPKGVGKTTLAKSWIKFILCEAKAEDMACGQCPSCQQFEHGTYSDFVEVRKLEEKKNISIDQIRDLQNHLSLSALSQNYKVALIKEIECLNEESFNAFLKTLEEPAGRTVLILTANSTNNIPLTILSRCSVLKLNPISQSEMLTWLKSLNVNDPMIDLNKISLWANGRPGLAKKLIDDAELYQWHEEQTKNCLKILQARNLSNKWKIIDAWFKHLPKNFNERTDQVLSILNVYQAVIRRLLLVKFNSQQEAKNPLFVLANSFTTQELADYLQKLDQTKGEIGRNINQQLALENLFI